VSRSAGAVINVRDDVGEQEVAILSTGPTPRARIDGVEFGVRFAWEGNELHLVRNDIWISFSEICGSTKETAMEGSAVITAPMPGSVAEVRVSLGAVVNAGEVLVILEAMKMEHQIQAPVSGQLSKVDVIVGQQVGMRQALMEITAVAGGKRNDGVA
jgi:acetyl/propionyl-CoA carboxylase alpha subunit